MLRKCPDCQLEKPATDFARSSPRCRQCALIRKKRKQREADARYRAAHPEARTEQNKRFYAKNREQEKARSRTYYNENKEQVARVSKALRETDEWRAWRKQHRSGAAWERELELQRKRRQANPELEREKGRIYYATNPQVRLRSVQWLKDHPEVNRFQRSMRRKIEKQATPSWANKDAIFVFFAEAVRLTRETGIPHEVDHIYPLKGKTSCGLHCEANLQVVPSVVNRKKKNRLHMHDGNVRCCAWPSIAVAMEIGRHHG